MIMLLEKDGEPKIYVGVDESNHGRFPEIFVGVFSKLLKDTIPSNLRKQRVGSHGRLFGKFSFRDYSFLSVEESDIHRIPRTDFLGAVLSSLIQDYELQFPLEFYVDGEVSKERQHRAKDFVAEFYRFPKGEIQLFSGARFDTTYPIVNIADEMAHYLYRHTSLGKTSKKKNRKTLIV